MTEIKAGCRRLSATMWVKWIEVKNCRAIWVPANIWRPGWSCGLEVILELIWLLLASCMWLFLSVMFSRGFSFIVTCLVKFVIIPIHDVAPTLHNMFVHMELPTCVESNSVVILKQDFFSRLSACSIIRCNLTPEFLGLFPPLTFPRSLIRYPYHKDI